MAAIHIAFGGSSARDLKAALKTYAQQFWQGNEDSLEFTLGATVLTCSDEFAIGPINDMDLPSGFYARLSWLGKFYEETFKPEQTLDDVDDALEWISDFYKKLAWIENDRKVVLWHGDNVIDQMGIRIVSSLLPECNLFEVKLEGASKSGLYTCESLLGYMNKISPVSDHQRSTWIDEWNQLIQTEETLRIWSDQNIQSVSLDYFDAQLISCCGSEPQKAEEIFFKVHQKVICEAGNAFLGYRLRRLVEAGVLAAKGPLVHFSQYTIWLKEPREGIEEKDKA